MGSNIIELAKLGHERAAELKASCGAVDVRSLAQLISDLATQLEVQFVRSTNQAVQLANAESKCMELAAGHWPRLQEQDINALMRFNETCEDGEGYDIGAKAMARLVEIGLAGKGPHGIRNITPFGQWVINAREGEVDLEPLKTEEDNIAESALRMAQLRTGASQ
ncbi:hypothetical protein AIJ09_001379 [Salmonella enterica subsp. enterica]|nr:hypothetical protein [Salmonella enterica]ECV5576016.1 hypothetical protein [Salmonella enterica subsp. enterica serovar Johannesburg]EEA9112313.1 hypothetical protein [Salmonella enterica subsp. enterica]EDX6500647.1 hypothetical protein [Salmonella enterica subsp. enterica serovar Johannesburg]EDY6172188.1 hypothetical protein [Salmonella enterica]